MNWLDTITQYEKEIRAGFFIGVLVTMIIWEFIAPRRALTVSRLLRWTNNLALVALNTYLLRLVFPAAALGMAVFAQKQGWGAFNYFEIPLWLAVLVSVVVMDFAIYLQHVMVHAIPLLWRLHRVHHADLDFDVTTGARFHPIEIILSMFIKLAVILVLGPPLVAVVTFEILLNVMSMFNHSNIRLPGRIDAFLRLFIVTPDVHRVHHSIEDNETNSNFGFSLIWWDRLFGTYLAQPAAGHEGMTIGIRNYRNKRQVSWLDGILTLPFKGKVNSYAINRRNWRGEGDD